MRRISIYLILLLIALFQFVSIALPPGNADLISIQSLALDIRRGDIGLLYPGADFIHNDEWIAHHEANLNRLGGRGEPNWCFYPPLIPWLVAPLANVNVETWRLVWAGIQIALIVGFAFLIRRLLLRNDTGKPPSLILIFALMVGSYPLARSVELGQTSLAIAVLIWWGTYSAIEHSPFRNGVTVGVAAFIKPFLIAIEMPDVFRRKWLSPIIAVAAWITLIVLSLVAVGLNAHREYADFLITLGNSQTAYSGNQSLFAGLLRLFTDLPVADYGFLTDYQLAASAKILAVIIIAVAVWGQWKSNAHSILSAGLWLSAVLLALPISWEHHLVFLLPVVALMWLRSETSRAKLMIGIITVLLSIYWEPLSGDHGIGRVIASFPLFGNLVLFGWLLVLHIRSKPQFALGR
ncbi:MAG: glycosyltransferase family 87 protein [Calditrichota bacterium]